MTEYFIGNIKCTERCINLLNYAKGLGDIRREKIQTPNILIAYAMLEAKEELPSVIARSGFNVKILLIEAEKNINYFKIPPPVSSISEDEFTVKCFEYIERASEYAKNKKVILDAHHVLRELCLNISEPLLSFVKNIYEGNYKNFINDVHSSASRVNENVSVTQLAPEGNSPKEIPAIWLQQAIDASLEKTKEMVIGLGLGSQGAQTNAEKASFIQDIKSSKERALVDFNENVSALKTVIEETGAQQKNKLRFEYDAIMNGVRSGKSIEDICREAKNSWKSFSKYGIIISVVGLIVFATAIVWSIICANSMSTEVAQLKEHGHGITEIIYVLGIKGIISIVGIVIGIRITTIGISFLLSVNNKLALLNSVRVISQHHDTGASPRVVDAIQTAMIELIRPITIGGGKREDEISESLIAQIKQRMDNASGKE